MTNRRSFLTSLLACGAAPGLGWAAAGSPAYLAAAGEADGSFALYGLAEDGTDTFRVPLAARGHAGAAHPTRAEAVAFARRPGLFALVIDCVTGRLLHQLTPPADRHFNGHGGFALGGAVLFTCEQDAASSAGVVGVWDAAAGYVRVGEFPSQGIGPHELLVMPDGRSLAVANGGIATDPTDRTKLNLATMRPNLSYLGFDGALLEQVELDPELWPSSIRHLAVRPDGLVGFAMQWEGEADPAPALLGLHQRGQSPVLAAAPPADQAALLGYAGSIAFSPDGNEVAITGPRGGRLHRFSAAKADLGAFLGAASRSDVCGLAPHPGGFLASDGLGGLIAIAAGTGTPRPLARANRAWDNHLVSLAPAPH